MQSLRDVCRALLLFMFLKFYSFFVHFLVSFNHYSLHALCFARVCFFLTIIFLFGLLAVFVTIVLFIGALHMYYLCSPQIYGSVQFFSCLTFLQGFSLQSVVHCVKIQEQMGTARLLL